MKNEPPSRTATAATMGMGMIPVPLLIGTGWSTVSGSVFVSVGASGPGVHLRKGTVVPAPVHPPPGKPEPKRKVKGKA
jgi:hypothetical protein